jgi:hypothetical protein
MTFPEVAATHPGCCRETMVRGIGADSADFSGCIPLFGLDRPGTKRKLISFWRKIHILHFTQIAGRDSRVRGE